MSTWIHRRMRCPVCGAGFAAEVATGLNVTRAAEARRAILAGRFHRHQCTGCRAEVEIDTSIVYTDFSRNHWVRVEPVYRLSEWRSLELECARELRVLVSSGAAILRERAPRLRQRLVFGVGELREKLLLWDAGLDDAVVEVAKLAMIASDLGGVIPGGRFLTTEVANSGDILGDQVDGDGTVVSRWQLPAAAIAAPSAAEERFPELFAGGFVSIARQLGAPA